MESEAAASGNLLAAAASPLIPYSSDGGSAIDGSEEDTFSVDALVLNAEEHRGDELEHECLEACHLDILLVGDLVDTIEHVALGGQLQER